MNLENKLQQGIQLLELACSPEKQQQLLSYLHLLQKWNKHYNLTAVRDIEQMLSVHLLDSLSIIPFINGGELLDVGTGAGLPGIPLAICFPEKRFTLLDSNGKKIRFCRQAIIELGLKNVNAVQQRVEDYQPSNPIDQITTRAFTSLTNMISWLSPLMTDATELLAMKGQLPQDEMTELQQQGWQLTAAPVNVPYLDAERHLLRIRASG